jgi:hypothetical protein
MYKIILLLLLIIVMYKSKHGFTTLHEERNNLPNTRYNSYDISKYMPNEYPILHRE